MGTMRNNETGIVESQKNPNAPEEPEETVKTVTISVDNRSFSCTGIIGKNFVCTATNGEHLKIRVSQKNNLYPLIVAQLKSLKQSK